MKNIGACTAAFYRTETSVHVKYGEIKKNPNISMSLSDLMSSIKSYNVLMYKIKLGERTDEVQALLKLTF